MARARKCRECGDPYQPKWPNQRVCSVNCAILYTRKQEAKKQEKQEKEQRKETRARKEKLKTRSDWLREAQAVCNKHIRERDKDEGCISCDKPSSWGGQWHASHYRPTGNCSPLRFHEMNIHKACSECNNYKSGNLTEFRIMLIKKIGAENVEYLESQNQAYSWDIEDVKDVKQFYRDKLKALKQG